MNASAITIALGDVSLFVPANSKISVHLLTPTPVDLASLLLTSPQTIVPRPGDDTKQDYRSDSKTLPLSAVPTTAPLAQPEASESSAPSDANKCGVANCDRVASGRRRLDGELIPMCIAHAYRLSNCGDVQADKPLQHKSKRTASNACELDNCDSQATQTILTPVGRFWVCSKHRSRFQKYKSFIDPQARRALSNSNAEASLSVVNGGSNPASLGVSGWQEASEPITLKLQPEAVIVDFPKPNGDSLPIEATQSDHLPLSDEVLLERFGPLIAACANAFETDSHYATDIITRARSIGQRRARKAEKRRAA
jgi:hypothetical protein